MLGGPTQPGPKMAKIFPAGACTARRERTNSSFNKFLFWASHFLQLFKKLSNKKHFWFTSPPTPKFWFTPPQSGHFLLPKTNFDPGFCKSNHASTALLPWTEGSGDNFWVLWTGGLDTRPKLVENPWLSVIPFVQEQKLSTLPFGGWGEKRTRTKPIFSRPARLSWNPFDWTAWTEIAKKVVFGPKMAPSWKSTDQNGHCLGNRLTVYM